MKEKKGLPTSKVQRATRFMKTGLKVGSNYAKHYSKKLVNMEVDKDELDKENAEEIYSTLSDLKGSALKVAQMLSMDQGVLPEVFATKFSEAQYKAPTMSGPLVVRTVKKYLGKSPSELFDKFDLNAWHGASMGQVHKAEKDNVRLAVKIQYPGVAESVVSDLKLVKPMAKAMFGLSDKAISPYMDEIQQRLLEETDYELELTRSQWISEKCKDLEGVVLPRYFPEWSGKKVIAMEWLDGLHLDEFLTENPDQKTRDLLGQRLWNFYDFQIHKLKIFHADAHPGNFLFREDGTVGVLDFGCIKEIPQDFYEGYFALIQPEILNDEEALVREALRTEVIYPDDKPEIREFFLENLKVAISILCRPFYKKSFDFGDPSFFAELYEYGERMAKTPEMRKNGARGSRDGIYINRTYFGLFAILHKLGARVNTE